ncbi:SWI/SNF-related matrix-associated actin-dependent regulator of chromatin subfamily A-like protein 1 isoform X3 [Carya illinoinensis]|uniref:SWI/SNF-related matrix-associated actin-dependent regulator of chromatin subfamily A-like protein 1 isoform X3 n=1 Tax=Carya illinoinensis TaxID=32201 RepID=UPI001C72005D|nr:SWI/SNF-related matrix-associated actin-dependent regulator of chromatin subfamily A-like protein 1 isoform X3 [Carya illinoinensis]
MELDDDDWGLSVEELDSLERDAFQKIAQLERYNLNPSSSSSSSSSSASSFFSSSSSLACSSHTSVKQPPPPSQHQQEHQQRSFPSRPTNDPSPKKVEVLSPGSRGLPSSITSKDTGTSLCFPKNPQSYLECKRKVEKLDQLVHRAIVAASAVPDLRDLYDRMPNHIESKLLPFQRDGVRFILQHGGRALLADEMGLGKTLQAIAVSACIQDSWPVLILTPSSLRLHWASMIQQWLDIPPSDILVLLPQCGGSNRAGYTIVSSNSKGSIQLDGLFNIISYDIVPKLQNLLMALEFKVVIADESHFLKNAQAKRTTATLPVIKKAQYAILLSGTPALSRPIELFKQLEALYPDVYKNVHEYGNRYCKGGIFGVYQGASNHEELHNLMKATVMIRRLKKNVLSELPVKRRQHVFLDVAEKDMRQINALFRELEVLKGKIKACKSQEEVEPLKFAEKNLINKIYTDSAEAKIPAVLDYLGTVIEAGCKFLIFAHHQPMIDSIHQFLLKKKVGCIRIDGSTPPASRQALVTDFQEKEATKAAVLSIRAGGVGLTLTAASTVIFAELSWTPGDLIQAEDRAHRIGQVSSVNVYYLLANDTVDDIIWDVVQSKLENLGQMLDGHEKTLEVSSSQPRSSPAKQKTLDSFMKRCNSTDDVEDWSKLKRPRH